MKETALYQFMTAQCRSKGVRVEELMQACGVSRSTLYRYMKGLSHIGPEVEEILRSSLALDEEEAAQFHRLIHMTSFDEAVIQAHLAMDRFLFETAPPAPAPGELARFVLYDRETYFRTQEELECLILADASHPGASCQVHIINCVEERTLAFLSHFLSRLMEQGIPSRAEHYLSFVDKDYLQNIQLFTSVIRLLPLASYKTYTAYYNTSPVPTGGLFHNTVLVRTAWREGDEEVFRYYWTSFQEDSLSSCAVFRDGYLYGFLTENLRLFRRQYHRILFDSMGINVFSQEALELESGGAQHLMKPNFCYNYLPFDVYETVAERCPDKFWAGFSENPEPSPAEVKIIRSYYLDYLRQRIHNTTLQPQTLVHSREGLLEFVKTGRISDHLENLPPLSAPEIRRTLEYIRDRCRDPEDSLILLITRGPLLANGFIFLVNGSGRMLIEYNQEEYRQGVFNNIHIENEDLAQLFIDYIENHLPLQAALSPEEGAEYLDGLIRDYLS